MVEHEVARQLVHELGDLPLQPVGRVGQLGERLLETAGHAHRAPAQRLGQLHVVVARHRERRARGHHRHHQHERVAHARPAVGQVAEEQGAAAPGVAPHAVGAGGVAQRREQRLELGGAAVHVADDVERPLVAPVVGRQGNTPQHHGVCLVGRAQHDHPLEPLPHELGQRLLELLAVPAHHLGRDGARGAGGGALHAHRLGQVEHQRRRGQIVPACEGEQRRAPARRHVGGVDHGHPPAPQPLAHDRVQHGEGAVRGSLVGLVVAHQRAALVGRHHLGGEEVAPREGGLARARRADEQEQRGRGERDGGVLHAAVYARGSTTVNVEPTPTSLATRTSPPMPRARSRAMASPNPLPSAVRV